MDTKTAYFKSNKGKNITNFKRKEMYINPQIFTRSLQSTEQLIIILCNLVNLQILLWTVLASVFIITFYASKRKRNVD